MTDDPGDTVPAPPVAKRITTVRDLHGERVTDHYGWLRDRHDPDVVAYLEAENEYTEAVLEGVVDVRDEIFDEIRSRIQETDRSAPVRRGDYWYAAHTEEAKQYRRYTRSHGSPDAAEQTIFDENEQAEGHEYFALGAFGVSTNQTKLAYAVDFDGDERYELHIRDLATGADLTDTIPDVAYGTAWSNDDRFLFYTKPDAAMRPFRIWRHELGRPVADDVLVFEEPDETFHCTVYLTRSQEFIAIHAGSKQTDEISVIPAGDIDTPPRTIWPRSSGVEYVIDHAGDKFYIVTNLDAENGRLVTAPVNDPTAWTEVLAHRRDTKLDDVDAFARHVVVWGRKNGLSSATIVGFDGSTPFDLAFADESYVISQGENPTFDTDVLRYTYSSLVTPPSVFDENVVTGERTLVKRQPVLGGYDPDDYVTERRWATATDGAKIPISIVAKRELVGDRPAPTLLYGYGAYEHSIEPSFSAARLSLLDRGFTYAIAHVRGGGVMGRSWYEAGKLDRKKNTFTDFIACAEYLIDEGYTTPRLLAARGGSAGGLVMGAVANMRPDLFAAIVAEVAFVDIVNTMLDASLPLTVTEYHEWGDPADADAYQYIRAYAPYENVEDQAYPAMYVTAGLNDPRVAYWEPAKWVARLRVHDTAESPIVLWTELGAGHGGLSGRYDVWRDEARVFAFILFALDIES